MPTIVEISTDQETWLPVGELEDLSPRGVRVRVQNNQAPAKGEARLAIAGYLVKFGFESTQATPMPGGAWSILFRIDHADELTEAVLELLFEDQNIENEITRTFLTQDTRRSTVTAD